MVSFADRSPAGQENHVSVKVCLYGFFYTLRTVRHDTCMSGNSTPLFHIKSSHKPVRFEHHSGGRNLPGLFTAYQFISCRDDHNHRFSENLRHIQSERGKNCSITGAKEVTFLKNQIFFFDILSSLSHILSRMDLSPDFNHVSGCNGVLNHHNSISPFRQNSSRMNPHSSSFLYAIRKLQKHGI